MTYARRSPAKVIMIGLVVGAERTKAEVGLIHGVSLAPLAFYGTLDRVRANEPRARARTRGRMERGNKKWATDAALWAPRNCSPKDSSNSSRISRSGLTRPSASCCSYSYDRYLAQPLPWQRAGQRARLAHGSRLHGGYTYFVGESLGRTAHISI